MGYRRRLAGHGGGNPLHEATGPIGGRLITPPKASGTCRAATGAFRHIDYLLVSAGLSETIGTGTDVIQQRANPHLPVTLTVEGPIESRFGTVFRGPAKLPTARVLGPILRVAAPAALATAITSCEQAVTAKSPEQLATAANHLYSVFLPAARREVAHATGADPEACQSHGGEFVKHAGHRY